MLPSDRREWRNGRIESKPAARPPPTSRRGIPHGDAEHEARETPCHGQVRLDLADAVGLGVFGNESRFAADQSREQSVDPRGRLEGVARHGSGRWRQWLFVPVRHDRSRSGDIARTLKSSGATPVAMAERFIACRQPGHLRTWRVGGSGRRHDPLLSSVSGRQTRPASRLP
jgi:hypothetical protein